MNLSKRVERLEKHVQPEKTWTPAPMILVHPGETVDQKVSEYEAENGPVDRDHACIVKFVESPAAKKHGRKEASNE
jgi:hypothetical protein